jgi:hypothetical protein
MKKINTKKAKRLLEELRESIAKKPNPFSGMTKEEIIEKIRQTREKLWEEKLASRYRF